MAFVEFGGNRHQLPAGDMLIGSGADCHLRLEGPGIAPRHAVLSMAPDQSVAIRKYDESVEAEVNGVRLGSLPQPLLHGDKITIGTIDLLFADERKSGSTQYISALKLPPIPDKPKPAGAPGKATAGTGGRLVCLTDGREYQILGPALTMGRDAKADVVVPGGQISRRHAEIVATPRGYVLVDYSTNGSWVNGERVQNQRLLARADIIRMGDEEFRFYADVAPAAPAAPAPAPQGAPTLPPPTPLPIPPGPPPPAYMPAQLAQTGFVPSPLTPASPVSPRTGEDVAIHLPEAQPAPPPAAAAPPAPPPAAAPVAAQAKPAAPQALAKFVVRTGAQKGERLLIKVPIVNIGRADYNDLVVSDESVSSQHAKLTRREGLWILTDLGSTNGTMVDGERIQEDTPLAPGCFVRFGDVQLVFEPTDDSAGVQAPKATRAMQAVKFPMPPQAAPPAPPAPPPAAPPPSTEAPPKKKGWFGAALAALLLPAAAALHAVAPLLG